MGKQDIMYYEIILNTITKKFTLIIDKKTVISILSHVKKITVIRIFYIMSFKQDLFYENFL